MLVRPALVTRYLRLPFLDEIGVISQLALAQNRVAGIDDLWLETGENLFDIDGRDFKEQIGLEYRQHPFHVLVQIPLTGHIQLRSEEHTSELQSRGHLVCRLLLEKKQDPQTHT